MSSPFTEPGRHHAIWKEWKRIGNGKDERFFLEHRQAVLESLSGPYSPAQVLLARDLHDAEPAYWSSLAAQHKGSRWFLIDGHDLDQVASVPANSGLCAVYSPRPAGLEQLCSSAFLLLVWELSDPGNLGTLVRAVQALCRGAVLVVGGCSPWSAKVARASAGSLLKGPVGRVPVADGWQTLERVREAGFALRSAFPRSGEPLGQFAWSGKDAVVLGNETRGLPDDVSGFAKPFTLPMGGEAESLNVAMTGSIVAWEWSKSGPR